MKFLSALSASLLLAGESWLVAAAGDCANVAVTAIPSCAQSCFLNGAPSVGCAASDFACQCEQEARLYAAIEGCVSDGCPSASYQAVIDGASSGESTAQLPLPLSEVGPERNTQPYNLARQAKELFSTLAF